MLESTIIMAIISVVLFIIAYLKGDQLHIKGLKVSSNMLIKTAPLLIVAFILAGLIQVLIPQELIVEWLGAEAGVKGILIGWFAGLVTPGGPYVAFPLAVSIFKSGASLMAVITYVVAWSIWNISSLTFEVALIGPKFTVIRILSTAFIPPLIGMIIYIFG
ncbi:permease [Selenihalanaerobacter shriftii]|uniref:Predicted permease n=1 Tax=Selenihalanaerobacter shriftii TaxID=142842 RepID=A0A1T4LEM1_9FIRM|nr:permease [Selenihalanaerobacter shriftii]SJZ53100.1 Predicted permease [Selenihalanaerobacter shriftii]